MTDVGIRTVLAQNYAEALRDSADGWIDDALAFCAPWGFNLADITVPVLLWHGEKIGRAKRLKSAEPLGRGSADAIL